MLVMAGVPALVFQACEGKFYEDCPPDRIIGDWGVVDHTKTFGEYDSLYYVVNPIGNINDSVYYNGNYTDSYYRSDPVRVMLRYTLSDSIQFNLDRLYTTETNPHHVIMIVEDASDSLHKECVLHLTREENTENLYKTGADSLFKKMLLGCKELKIRATNGSSSSEPEGSQNYEFTLYASGFAKALSMADSLNRISRAKPSSNLKDNGKAGKGAKEKDVKMENKEKSSKHN